MLCFVCVCVMCVCTCSKVSSTCGESWGEAFAVKTLSTAATRTSTGSLSILLQLLHLNAFLSPLTCLDDDNDDEAI